jgi:lipoprotein-anchoring transpeptidase ErfK/SrfK
MMKGSPALLRLSAGYLLAAACYGGLVLFGPNHNLFADSRYFVNESVRLVQQGSGTVQSLLGQRPLVAVIPPAKIAAVEPRLSLRGSIDEAPVQSREAVTPAVAESPPAAIAASEPEQKAPPPDKKISPAPVGKIARVEQRLRDRLSDPLFENFDLFLYVSKAAKGPWAQHMYVFAKEESGQFTLLHDWPVSTGREKIETNPSGKTVFSSTPVGYYELDPDRMWKTYHSTQWGAPMPHAMFLDWTRNGYQTGVAIHAATESELDHLGRRASAGCVRLSPRAAATLFNLIRTQYRGKVPRFVYNERTQTLSNKGEIARDASGEIEYQEGYRVLVFIENYGGGVIATVS